MLRKCSRQDLVIKMLENLSQLRCVKTLSCMSQTLASRFGMDGSYTDNILDRRLQWLGHVGRMEDTKLPFLKSMYWELQKKRACHGTMSELLSSLSCLS